MQSIEEFISQARRVAKQGDRAGIGVAAEDARIIVYTDFAAPPKSGMRDTGIQLRPKTLVTGGQLIAETAVVGSFDFYLGAPSQPVVSGSGLAAGSISPVSPFLFPDGGKLILTSLAPVTAGRILLILELIPLG
jgi:hypothetical protein